jgi:hypothetical protein
MGRWEGEGGITRAHSASALYAHTRPLCGVDLESLLLNIVVAESCDVELRWRESRGSLSLLSSRP